MTSSDKVALALVRYRHELYGCAWGILRNHHEAEDVLQSSAVVLLRDARRDRSVRDLRSWMRKIVRNQAIMLLRKRPRGTADVVSENEMTALIGDLFEADDSGHLEIAREQEVLRECLSEMRPEHRELLRLRFVVNESYDQLSLRMNKSCVAARKSISRLRRALADCIHRKMSRSFR